MEKKSKAAFDAPRSNVFNFKADEIIVRPELNVSRMYEPDISGLIASIKQYGLLQPVKVRKNFEGKPELIFGFQRVRAIRAINAELPPEQHMLVPAQVVTANDAEAEELNIEENVQRNTLSQVEVAHLIRKMEQRGKTEAEICERFKRSAATINETKLLLSLPGKLQKQIHDGEIPANVGIFAAKLDPDKRDAVLAEAREASRGGKPSLTTAVAAARKHEALPENRVASRKMPEVKAWLQKQVEDMEAGSPASQLAGDMLDFIAGKLGDKAMENRWNKHTHELAEEVARLNDEIVKLKAKLRGGK